MFWILKIPNDSEIDFRLIGIWHWSWSWGRKYSTLPICHPSPCLLLMTMHCSVIALTSGLQVGCVAQQLRHCLGCLHPTWEVLWSATNSSFVLTSILGSSRWRLKYLDPGHTCTRWIEFEVSGFGQAQMWPLRPFGEWSTECEIPPSLLLCLSSKMKIYKN